jgi:multidrug efflux pump subunit AcrA (membrane-fusion protein)
MSVRLGVGRTSKWVAGGVVVVALGALAVLVLRPSGEATSPAAATATAKRGDVTTTVSAAGTVSAVNSRTLSFGASGTVDKVLVKAGDTVKAGQVLARLDTDDLTVALSDATDGVDSAEDSLTRAEDAAEAQAAAEKAAAEATTAQASTSAAPTSGANPSNGTNPTGGNSTDSTNQNGGGNTNGGGSDAVFSATQRLNNARLTLTEAERSLAGATIKAPVSGKVLSVSGAVGSRVSTGSAFIVLDGLTDVAVKAQVTEADIASLKLGQTANITIADGDTQDYAGAIAQIDPVGTVSGRLVKYGATITFADPPKTLLLGQTVNVIVTTSAATGVIFVPSAAVTGVHDDMGTVTVRTSAGEAARPVEIGLRGDLYTEIKSGVAEGDVVLLNR